MEPKSFTCSAIICTYNPAESIFSECLRALSATVAHFPVSEIIIIDNNSPEPLASKRYVQRFLELHPSARVIVETTQGLTPARIRGIRESTGDFIVFIDDDNFIDKEYFAVAARIFGSHPHIGAFSGQVTLTYDEEPQAWTRRYWGMLVHRKLDRDVWSNLMFNNDTMPNGAGLCVSRDVANHYVKLFEDGKRNFKLDRSRDSLLSGGDNDLAMCACDLGKGMGLFKDLHLKHFTPAKRFTLGYLSKLAYGIYFSSAVLLFMRTGKIDKTTFRQKVKFLMQLSLIGKNDRVIQRACRKGFDDAVEAIESNKLENYQSR